MNYKDIAEKQLLNCNQSGYEFIRDTGWLDNVDEKMLKKLYAEFTQEAHDVVKEISVFAGLPAYSTSSSKYFRDWFPEAFFAAGWIFDDKLLFVAAEHHDREAPIALLIGALKFSQIEELKA